MSGHKAEETKGRLKEAIGDATGDKALRREGKIDQGAAAAKRKTDEVADNIRHVVNPKG